MIMNHDNDGVQLQHFLEIWTIAFMLNLLLNVCVAMYVQSHVFVVSVN